MTGYFSQLLRQTGVRVNAEGGAPMPHGSTQNAGEFIAPMEMSAERLVDRQAGSAPIQVYVETEKKSQPSSSEITGESWHGLITKSVEHERQRQTQSEPAVSANEISSSREERRMNRNLGMQDDFKEENPVRQISEAKQLRQHSEPFSAADQHRQKSPAPEAVEKSTSHAGQALPREIHLKDVHEWLAGGLEASTEVIAPNESTTAMPQAAPPARFAAMEQRALAPTSRPSPEQPEVHDFNLSIGTIHLTVEQPQKPMTGATTPPARTERTPKPPSSSSRLSRHYIRTR